jgi:hypothetical protein
MTSPTELAVRAARPTDASVDAEFDPARRSALLQTILATPVAAPTRRPRRTVLLVAAGLAVLVATGGVLGDVSSRLPAHLRPVTAQPAVADTLDRLAARAARRPVLPPLVPGQYRAVTTVDQQSGNAVITHQSYVAADGWTWRRDTENLNRTWFLYPTTDELDPATLPTDPGRLEAALRRQSLGTASQDEGLFKAIGELALLETTPVAVRVASIQVLTAMSERPPRTVPGRKGGPTTPTVTVLQGVLDGRPVTGARFTDATRPGLQLTYWFDAATSDLLRTDQTWPDGTTFSSEIRDRTTVDRLPTDITDRLGTRRVEKIIK